MDFKYSDKAAESVRGKREADIRQGRQKREDGVPFYGMRENRFLEHSPRTEALGYTKRAHRTEGHVHDRKDAVVQRKPGVPDGIIDSLSQEKQGELFWARFATGKGVDASASETQDGGGGIKKVGSLYFENGRFRLTHIHGPEIGLREDTVRYAVQGRSDKMIELLRKMRGEGKKKCIEALKRGQGYTMTEIGGDSYPEGKLIELFFEDGIFVGHHPSRGGMEKYTISPVGEAAKEDPKERTEQQRRYAMEIGRVVAASQQFGATLSEVIMTAFIMGKNDIHTESGVAGAQKAIREMIGKNKVSGLITIGSRENIIRAIGEAKKEAIRMTQRPYQEILTKRLQGYFANQFFHVSGIAEKMGLLVDEIDMPGRG